MALLAFQPLRMPTDRTQEPENGGCNTNPCPLQKGTISMRSSSHSPDRILVTFDDDHTVANAGLIQPATLAEHLGLRQLFEEYVHLGAGPGHANVGLKAMTLIYSALAGGDCIEDAEGMRVAATAEVRRRAGAVHARDIPEIVHWGHVAQLDRVFDESIRRSWAAGAGTGQGPVTLDVDSTICETYGLKKQGARFGYTNVRGYHPLLATVAGTEEVVGVRLRGGNANTGRGVGTEPVSGQLYETTAGRSGCCPAFLSPFGHRHSLLGPSCPPGELGLPHSWLTGPTPGPRRGFHVPHGRDPTGEGALCTPGPRCSHDRLLVTGRRCRISAASPTLGATSHPRGFRCRGINESSLAFTRPAFPLPVAPGWSGRPWAFPRMLRTPPLPATHVKVGTGLRTLTRNPLSPTCSTLQSASPLITVRPRVATKKSNRSCSWESGRWSSLQYTMRVLSGCSSRPTCAILSASAFST